MFKERESGECCFFKIFFGWLYCVSRVSASVCVCVDAFLNKLFLKSSWCSSTNSVCKCDGLRFDSLEGRMYYLHFPGTGTAGTECFNTRWKLKYT